jgi:hypothetical protein
MPIYKTREEWLLAAVEEIRPIFVNKGHHIPQNCQVSCGFASTGTRSHHIGQCWPRESSTDERNQIFISPALYEPAEVLDTLVHELVHAVDDCEHKHGKEFKKIALSLGMMGPMRSAGAGPELKIKLEEIAKALGRYPHGKLKVTHRIVINRSRPRAKCPACGFQVPMLKRFLAYGAPICPKDKVEMEQVGDWEAN